MCVYARRWATPVNRYSSACDVVTSLGNASIDSWNGVTRNITPKTFGFRYLYHTGIAPHERLEARGTKWQETSSCFKKVNWENPRDRGWLIKSSCYSHIVVEIVFKQLNGSLYDREKIKTGIPIITRERVYITLIRAVCRHVQYHRGGVSLDWRCNEITRRVSAARVLVVLD